MGGTGVTDSSNSLEPLRVIHVGKYFPPHHGGMERYLQDLVLTSQKFGVKCSALVHESKKGFKSSKNQYFYGDNEVTIVRVATWFRALFTPISPTFGWHLRNLIKRERAQLLHLHLPNPSAFWALLFPTARRLDWVIHWQSDVVTPESGLFLKLIYWLIRPFECALLKKSKCVVASSPRYLCDSNTLAPFRSKCVSVPLGIQDQFYSTVPKVSKSMGALNLIAIGRLAHYKGHDVLLHAIAKTDNVNLSVVGDGRRAQHLQKLALDLGISHRVVFHGAVNDSKRNRLLEESDCLCLASTDKTESFGLVLLEAMSASKACIVSDVAGSGMSWIVDNEKTGLVFKNRSVAALSAALNRLDADRELMKQMGANGRIKYERHFTIEQTTAKILSLYRSG